MELSLKIKKDKSGIPNRRESAMKEKVVHIFKAAEAKGAGTDNNSMPLANFVLGENFAKTSRQGGLKRLI